MRFMSVTPSLVTSVYSAYLDFAGNSLPLPFRIQSINQPINQSINNRLIDKMT